MIRNRYNSGSIARQFETTSMMSVEDNPLDIGWEGSTAWVGAPVSVPGAGSASVVRGRMLGIATQGAVVIDMIRAIREKD